MIDIANEVEDESAHFFQDNHEVDIHDATDHDHQFSWSITSEASLSVHSLDEPQIIQTILPYDKLVRLISLYSNLIDG